MAAADFSSPSSQARVMRVGKESAGIQSEPLAKTGTPLTTKVNDSPHSSGLLAQFDACAGQSGSGF